MADLLIKLDEVQNGPTNPPEAIEKISIGPRGGCWIYGKKGTFILIRNGEDFIASIGYACLVEENSSQETLTQIFQSFQESQIESLKKRLIGQYVLVIKKNQKIFVFSDVMGARNIFYSDDGIVISSSFSQVEDQLKTGQQDLDMHKVFEYLAVKHILYPAWLGRSTKHKRIKWLLPYEYLMIDIENSSFKIGSIVHSIDNTKQFDRSALSSDLLSSLRSIINRNEFKDSVVAASLSGGRDSRLVATIAAEKYSKVRFRTAVSTKSKNSIKDLRVARKVSRKRGVPHDIYRFQHEHDEERFRELTEGFSPQFNHSITPLIDNTNNYSLGFGGIFGTELFMPITEQSVEEYIQSGIEKGKKNLHVEDDFWGKFRETLWDEFRRTKKHYQLIEQDDRDYIRLMNLLITARYGSFIMSAFNQKGYQLEPYGSYSILELALRVTPSLWGNHRKFGGDAWIQQTAMASLNKRIARVLTFSAYRPMMPISIPTFPLYLLGNTIQASVWLRRKFIKNMKQLTKTEFPGGYYLSYGWENSFLSRTREKYGMEIHSS